MKERVKSVKPKGEGAVAPEVLMDRVARARARKVDRVIASGALTARDIVAWYTRGLWRFVGQRATPAKKREGTA